MPATSQLHGSDPHSEPEFFIIEEYRISYKRVLESIHTNLKPKRYFEVGTLAGDTLALAECASLAVDSQFQVERDVVGNKPACLMYQMTSDDFFAQFDPAALLGGAIDLAFLDGMHWFEYLLRDFINTEKYCRRNSIVLMHDCMPTDTYIARRNQSDPAGASLSPHPDWWAGDVWKAVAILMKYRPDLVIYGCKADPTGLIAITNLDPESSLLEERYFEAIRDYRGRPSDLSNLREYASGLISVEPEAFLSHELLAAKFWL